MWGWRWILTEDERNLKFTHPALYEKIYLIMIQQFGVFKDMVNIFNEFNDEKYLFSKKFYHENFDTGEKWAKLYTTTTGDWNEWRLAHPQGLELIEMIREYDEGRIWEDGEYKNYVKSCIRELAQKNKFMADFVKKLQVDAV